MEEVLITRLTNDILSDQYFNDLFIKCASEAGQRIITNNGSQSLSQKELNHLLRFSDILSNSNSSAARNKAHQIITYLNHKYSSDPAYRTISKAVFAKLGNFPAINYLERRNENEAELPFLRRTEKTLKEIEQAVPGREDFCFY